MSDESLGQTPTVFSSKERAALVAKALSEAARRARFSTKRKRSSTAGSLRARRGAEIYQLVRTVSFVVGVALPLIVYGIYIFLIASSQYVAEARFTVRSGMPQSMDTPGGGIPMELIAQDTQIIMNYIPSRAMFKELDKQINLVSLYADKQIDYFSRLSASDPIERLVKYWESHAQLKIVMPGGIVSLYVSAFSADDSVKIARAVLDASEELVNRMNDQMRSDAVSLAQTETKRAEARLAQTRTALETARNSEGMLSAEATSEAYDTLISGMKTQLLTLQQNYESQRQIVRADAPQMRQLQTRMDAAKDQIGKLEARITQGQSDATPGDLRLDGSGQHVLSGSMTRLDYAKLENDIAEKIYAASLASLEQARIASELKLMYVNRFIEPVAADKPKYPMRVLDFALVSALCLSIWGLLLFTTRIALDKLL